MGMLPVKEPSVIFVVGGIGADRRYWRSGVVYQFKKEGFPDGTMLVNVAGCFALGFVMAFFEEPFVFQPLRWLFLTIGILGGLTSFVTFSYETLSLLWAATCFSGTAIIICSLMSCLGGTWAGKTFPWW